MKQELTTYQVAHLLLADKENNGYTYAGAFALAEWFEQMESDTGEAIEFDAVAIRCDWNEYSSLRSAYAEHTGTDEDKVDASDEWLERYFTERTNIILFQGEAKGEARRIMVQQF